MTERVDRGVRINGAGPADDHGRPLGMVEREIDVRMTAREIRVRIAEPGEWVREWTLPAVAPLPELVDALIGYARVVTTDRR